MSLLQRINNFLEDNFGNGIIDENDESGVVVSAVAELYIVIRGDKQVNQHNLSINFADAVNNTTYYEFPFDIEASIKVATSITLQNLAIGSFTYSAIPAWYNRDNKRIYYAADNTKYFAVNKSNLSPVNIT